MTSRERASRAEPALGGIRKVALLTLAGALAILVWQVLEANTPPDTTTLGLLVVFVVALIAARNPQFVRNVAERLEGVEAFGVKVQIARVRQVERRFPTERDGVPFKARPRHRGQPKLEVRDVVRELRRKLRFSVTAVLGERWRVVEPTPQRPDRVTEQPLVGRLEKAGLLEPEEADLAFELLGELSDQLVEWEPTERKAFLDNAWRFAFRLGSRTFARHARMQFARAGWFVGDSEQAPGHRPDFIAVKNDRWAMVAARVAAPPESIDETVARLARNHERGKPRPVVVVPDHVDHLRKELDEGPVLLADGEVLVVRLSNLLASPEMLGLEEPGPSESGAGIPPEAKKEAHEWGEEEVQEPEHEEEIEEKEEEIEEDELHES